MRKTFVLNLIGGLIFGFSLAACAVNDSYEAASTSLPEATREASPVPTDTPVIDTSPVIAATEPTTVWESEFENYRCGGPAYLRDGYRWSPDGKYLLLTDAYIINLESPDPTDQSILAPLFTQVNRASYPSWSPDGTHIVLIGNVAPPPSYKPQIYIYDFFSGELTQLTNTSGYAISGQPWSPDGQQIIYHDHTIFMAGDKIRITTISNDNEERLPVPYPHIDISPPRWSPDGQWISFVARIGVSQGDASNILYLVALDGLELIPLTQEGNCIDHGYNSMSWSPDGRQLAFSMQQDEGDWNIYIADAETRQIRQLTDSPTIDVAPNWSPDGQQLTFLSMTTDPTGYNFDHNAIHIINADGTDLRLLVEMIEGEEGFLFHPEWVPHQDAISFFVITIIECPHPGQWNCRLGWTIDMINTDGSNRVRLATLPRNP